VPALTVSLTLVPALTLAPAAGEDDNTVPAFCLDFVVVIAPTAHFAAVSAVVAAACV
jgi:hypothetical protein